MRKTLLIVLITIHFFGNTEISQLFKLPQLISHYFQHSRQDPNLSFFTFLNMHYGGDDGTSADDHEDNKLPYHSNSQIHSFNIVISSLPKNDMPIINIDEAGNLYGSWLTVGNPSKHVLLILQPPRLA